MNRYLDIIKLNNTLFTLANFVGRQNWIDSVANSVLYSEA